MRKIDLIVLHCSDSDVLAHDNIETIRSWHTQRGFTGPDGVRGTEDDIGYHWFITREGRVFKGRDEKDIGAHVKGHNATSVGICFSGRTFNDFHSKQFTAGRALVKEVMKRYGLKSNQVKLHRDLEDHGKTCPNFSLEEFWSEHT